MAMSVLEYYTIIMCDIILICRLKSHKMIYRLTITGLNTKALEATCSQIINASKDHEFRVKGPVRIPTKTLRITTRKSPCGEGTNTWDRYEMRIHKRVIDLFCPSELVKDVTSFKLEPGVDVNVNVTNIEA